MKCQHCLVTSGRPGQARGPRQRTCTFCEIVAGREPARVFHDDDDYMVFQNRLSWVPVMLLVVPKLHMSQQELWTQPSQLAGIGALAVRIGEVFCPTGFRVLSNFGRNALQTQPHAHVHVVGGAELGPYVIPRHWVVGG